MKKELAPRGTTLTKLRRNRYAKLVELTLLGLVTCTMLAVTAGLAGVVWLTLLLGLMAYAALAGCLFAARRIVRSQRYERSRYQ